VPNAVDELAIEVKVLESKTRNSLFIGMNISSVHEKKNNETVIVIRE
jgi:hypothetical protein